MPALLALFLLFAQSGFAQGREPIAFDAKNFDANQATFSFVVAGASDQQPYMVAGHLILRVRQGYDDYAFDWGVFDPTKKDFFIDYMRGILNYEHIVRPFYETIRIYQFERRQLTEYLLRLTPRQKQKIIDGLIVWGKPENRIYAYDIVFRNCSTVIGGLIVDAVGAKLAEQMKQPAPLTIRQSGLQYLAHFPPIEVFTDIMGGIAGDTPMTQRDMFYLPILVPQVLASASAYDDDQQPLNEHLLGEPLVLLRGDNVGPIDVSWSTYVGIAIASMGILLLSLAFRFNAGRKLFIVYAGLFLFLSGFFGCIITFLGFFSHHTFALKNLHVFFFWPIDLIAVFVLLRARRRLALKAYAACHLAAAVATTIFTLAYYDHPQNLGAGWKLVVPMWAILFVFSQKERYRT